MGTGLSPSISTFWNRTNCATLSVQRTRLIAHHVQGLSPIMLISSVTGHFEHRKTPESQLEVGLHRLPGDGKILKPPKRCVTTFIRPFSPNNEPCGISGTWLDIKKAESELLSTQSHHNPPPTPPRGEYQSPTDHLLRQKGLIVSGHSHREK